MVRKIITVLAICLLLILCSNSEPNEVQLGTQQPYIKVNEEVKECKASEEVKGADIQKIVDVLDVTGDMDEETIIVTRNMTTEERSPIIVKILSNSSEELFVEELGEGVAPGLFLADFDSDGVKDIFISINTGGSRGDILYKLLSYKNNTFVHLNLESIHIAKYISFDIKDGYIYFNSPLISNTVGFKLSDEDCKEYELLNTIGQELSYPSPLWLEPNDLDNDGVWELKCQTYFSIAYRRPIANVTMSFKYDNDKWIPNDVGITHVVNN